MVAAAVAAALEDQGVAEEMTLAEVTIRIKERCTLVNENLGLLGQAGVSREGRATSARLQTVYAALPRKSLAGLVESTPNGMGELRIIIKL
jgi:hypothetical protein